LRKEENKKTEAIDYCSDTISQNRAEQRVRNEREREREREREMREYSEFSLK